MVLEILQLLCQCCNYQKSRNNASFQPPPPLRLCQYKNNETASKIEKELISKIGRKDINKGPLTNMTDGGEGSEGRICTIETRKKISMNCNNKGKNNPKFGKKVTDETRKKISIANTGKKYSDDVNKKKALKGDKNPMHNKSIYSVWLLKFGKEIADEKYKQWKNNVSKNANRKSLYQIWHDKFGKNVADQKYKNLIKKLSKRKKK